MQKIIAANWKMYKTRPEAAQTAGELAGALASGLPDGRSVVIFPSFTNISEVADVFVGNARVAVGGQDVYPEAEGAFTGEVSVAMLKDAGAAWVLTGHSERRHVLGEGDGLVARKTAFALAHSLKVMLCIGETLQEREAGKLNDVLLRQVTTAFAGLPADQLEGRFAVAYEPVWAIGTGKVAGPAEVLDAHAVTRAIICDVAGQIGKKIPLLYGGSVKPDNAAALLGLDNVDGLLVGGASLTAQSFIQIVKA
ncbi:MAG: triose-phosphate isomerase [Desulfovibrio sp.]|jgi:triosephosphate isomerase|nr:triose-phosphate isomerase [Desulfovibrio sp.]